MQAFPAFDKSLWHMLAQGTVEYEKRLRAEQFSFFIIDKFAQGIKNKSKDELLMLSIRLDTDAKSYPGKAYFFNALLRIVKRQLNKSC
jgi:hypothetical protein